MMQLISKSLADFNLNAKFYVFHQGKLSDVFGRKQLLLVSLLGTAMGYYMTSLPTSLLFLALSRIPAGTV